MASCPAFDPLAPYLVGTVDFVECHARALGEEGYRALGWGSPVGGIITGLTTIYIALIGYRMLFGDLPSVRETVVSAARIGLVVALATQWSTYQVLIYDIVVDEPAALASRVLAPGGLGGNDPRALIGRAQATYDQLDTLTHPEVDALPASEPVPATNTANASPQSPATTPPPPRQFNGLSLAQITSLTAAQSAFVVGALGGLLATRVIAGVLLALGPLFAAFLLFEASIGLFIGWLRVLMATVIGGVGVLAVLAIELAILLPQVAALQQAIASGLSVPTLVNEISATAMLFALLILATLVGATLAAIGLKLPERIRISAGRFFEPRVQSLQTASPTPVLARTSDTNIGDRPRSQRLVDAVEQLDRRDARTLVVAGAASRAAVTERLTASGPAIKTEPLGQSGRRTTRRASSAARRRDID